MKITNMLFCGVGGQGVLKASEVIAITVFNEELDVKKSEIHGLSQRGGSVISHIRFGKKVYSPKVPEGSCDFIVSFEKMEALRYIEFLNQNAKIIINSQKIMPTTVTSGNQTYPENIIETYKKYGEVYEVDALAVALELENVKTVNTVMLGYLSNFFDFSIESWFKAIETQIKPKYVDLNKKAFEKGRDLTNLL